MLTAVCFNGYFRIFLRKIRCWMECFIIFVMAWCCIYATFLSRRTLTATAELNAEKPNLTLNCYWISVHYFSPIFWKFPKKLRSCFHLLETWTADKNPATFERKTVDKTQFDKYWKCSELDAEKNTENNFVEFRYAKF